MRKVVLAALLATAATGCIIEDDNDPPPPPDDVGLITANWSFKELATNTTLGCPSGFGTTAVYAYPVDANGNRAGQPIIDLYNCADLTGTAEYPLDAYEVYLEITNSDNTSLYAQSISALVDIVDQDKTFTTTIADDGGYFFFDWELRGEVSGQALSCADVQSSGVEILSTLNGTTDAVSDIFPCEQRSAYTGALLAGTYTVSISALDAADASIGTAPALTNKAIQAPNKVTDLGLVQIPITGQ